MDLDIVNKSIRNCKECPLFNERLNSVIGVGNKNSKILFIKYNVIKEEEKLGKSLFFDNLKETHKDFFDEIGLDMNSVYVTYCIKCYYKKFKMEYDLYCNQHLKHEIKCLKPKIICPIGGKASRKILNMYGFKYTNMKSIHGKIHEITTLFGTVYIIPIFEIVWIIDLVMMKDDIVNDYSKIKEVYDDTNTTEIANNNNIE